MSEGVPGTYRAKTALEICKNVPIGDEAKAILTKDLSPRQFLDVLIDQGLFNDAVRFMAFALPKRESVWWGLRCAQQAYGASPAPEPMAKALKATDLWLNAPNEDNRRGAMTAAEVAGFGTPAGCAALAAFFSGGSMGPANVQAIPPGETLVPQAVAGAVMLAVVVVEPEKAEEKNRRFLSQGFEVANGSSRWGGR